MSKSDSNNSDRKMALYDNPLWILSHIRNSFIVSDDTGNSELVMAGDKFPGCIEKLAERESVLPFLKLDDIEDAEDEFRPKSLEIRENNRPIGYRPRCNTEIKLEKMKRDRKNAPNIRTVSWRPPSCELSQEELDQLFPRKQPPQLVNKPTIRYKYSPLKTKLNVLDFLKDHLYVENLQQSID